MRPDFELLHGLLVRVNAAVHGIAFDTRGHRDGACYAGAGPFGRLDDFARRLVQHPVVEGPQPDSDFLSAHNLSLTVSRYSSLPALADHANRGALVLRPPFMAMPTCQRTRSLVDPCPVRRGSNTRSGPKNAGHSTRKKIPVNPKTPFPLIFSLPPICPPIGNKFSNHWKTPETFFPIIGKITQNFPPIGNFFSNHWKTFPPYTKFMPLLSPPLASPSTFTNEPSHLRQSLHTSKPEANISFSSTT